MAFAEGGSAALAELARQPFDVVVTDLRMPGMDGVALLRRVQELQPEAARILLSGTADTEMVARASGVAQRLLAKPCDVRDLTRVVERSSAVNELARGERLRHAASGATALPSAPRVYCEMTTLLANPEASMQQVADVVERDVAMAARVLQLANSAFFGLSRQVTRIGEAVTYLGLNVLKAVVLSSEALEAFRSACPIEHFSIEAVERRSALVARVARRLLPRGAAQEEAFSAALLHDIGVLVLAAREPEYLAEVLAITRREQRWMVDVEQQRRGATHAEVGAHLLALWGLPHAIVEAVAYHHRPQTVAEPVLDAIAVVYIAGTLVDEALPAADRVHGPTAPELDIAYLTQLGVADRAEEWRELVAAETQPPGS
jgi:putative nucleotidyltransferase with HDIG domain